MHYPARLFLFALGLVVFGYNANADTTRRRVVQEICLPICCNCRPAEPIDDLYVELVGGHLKYGERVLRPEEAKDYLNEILRIRKKSIIWLFPRSNATVGDVAVALEFLRSTNARGTHVWLWYFGDHQALPRES